MSGIQYPENGKKNINLKSTDLCGNTRNEARIVNIIQRLLEGQYINLLENGDTVTISVDVSTDYYNKHQINELMGDLDTVKFKIVDTLPAIGAENVIYLVEKTAPDVGYDQYIWDADSSTFFPIGDTDIDLSDYYTKLQADNKFQEKLSTASGITTVSDTTDFSQVSVSDKTVKQATGLSIWNYIKSKLTGAISSVIQSDLGTSKAMATTSDGKIGATLVTTDELYTLRGSDTSTTLQAQIDKIWDEMWKKIYPVGSIYTTITQDNPATLFGGTWEIVSAGRYLRGEGESGTAGTFINQQLPNIKGHIDCSDGMNGFLASYGGSRSGALNRHNRTSSNELWFSQDNKISPSTNGWANGIEFNAANSNSIYTDNGNVIPNSYTVHFWKRTS